MSGDRSNHRPADPRSASIDELPASVVEAYRSVDMLHNQGWTLRALEYDTACGIGTVVAQSPWRRVVRVSWDGLQHKWFRQQVPEELSALVLLKLAHDLVELGRQDAQSNDDLLDLLRMMVPVMSRRPDRRGPRSWVRSDPLPTMSAAGQPAVRCRAAAWLLARLIGKYGWRVSEIGRDIAGGGFIAEIPGDAVLAVFPAGMPFDGTAASVLAGLLAQLSLRELAVLVRLDYRALWAADHRAGTAG
jgi:hypothetical protein